MHTVPITVKCIAQTRVNWPQVIEWLETVGVKAPDTVKEQLTVGSDAGALIALAGKRCYNSYEPHLNPNVSKIRSDMAEYLENILKSGHGSVLEHATATFAIEGVTRVFTAEMNRHRAGVGISEASLRYIRFDDIGYWLPESLKPTTEELRLLRTSRGAGCVLANGPEGVPLQSIDASTARGSTADEVSTNALRRVLTQAVFARAFEEAEASYRQLCDIWNIDGMTDFNQKKILTSMFRRIVPMGCSTGGVWTGNMRAWRHMLELRSSRHAEEEIRVVFNLIAEQLVAAEPMLFSDFTHTDGEWLPRYRKV